MAVPSAEVYHHGAIEAVVAYKFCRCGLCLLEMELVNPGELIARCLAELQVQLVVGPVGGGGALGMRPCR